MDSLLSEDRDSDFEELLVVVLGSLSQVKFKGDPEPELIAVLNRIPETIGADPYVSCLVSLPAQKSRKWDILLQPLQQPHVMQRLTHPETILPLVSSGSVSPGIRLWLAELAFVSFGGKPELVGPAMEYLGTTRDEPFLQEAVSRLLRHSGAQELLVKYLEDALLDPKLIAGTLLLLGACGDPNLVHLVGPFIQDVCAIQKLSAVVFKRERLTAMVASLERTGATAFIHTAWEQGRGAEGIAASLAENRGFHRAISQSVSGGGVLFGLMKLFVDPSFAGVLKEMVSDTDLPTRRAAAQALVQLAQPSSIEYLKVGLVDRDKVVREKSREAMRAVMTEAEFQSLLDEMQAEAKSLAQKLEPLSKWAQASLGSVASGLVSAVDTAKGAASSLGSKLMKTFRRNPEGEQT